MRKGKTMRRISGRTKTNMYNRKPTRQSTLTSPELFRSFGSVQPRSQHAEKISEISPFFQKRNLGQIFKAGFEILWYHISMEFSLADRQKGE